MGRGAALIRVMVRILRDAPWLTADRVHGYSRLVAFFGCVALAALWLPASNGIDAYGRPIGTDFSSFYAAGRLALEGQAAAAYDWTALHAVEQSLFGLETPLYIWSYPPFALLPMSGLALLPYGWALGLFLLIGFAAYWLVVRRLAPPGSEAFWAVAGFPAVYFNFAFGQNGFISTALLGAGLALLDRRPVLAGILIGLMAYKPQLMLIVPIALACGGYWRAIAAAAATVAVLVIGSVMTVGFAPWQAFITGLGLSREAILENGATGFYMLQSVLAAVRLVGGSSEVAWVAQVAAALVCVVIVASVWRSSASLRIRNATLVTAAILATPFINVYDLVLLALPLALIAGAESPYRPRPWEALILFVAWFLPLVCMSVAQAAAVPLTPFVLIGLLAICLQRARGDAAPLSADPAISRR